MGNVLVYHGRLCCIRTHRGVVCELVSEGIGLMLFTQLDTSYRLPFYWEIKILVLLYVSLPQTQVSPAAAVFGDTW